LAGVTTPQKKPQGFDLRHIGRFEVLAQPQATALWPKVIPAAEKAVGTLQTDRIHGSKLAKRRAASSERMKPVNRYGRSPALTVETWPDAFILPWKENRT
jgi:hypothetical protein